MLPQELTLTSRSAAPCILRQETLTHTFTFDEPAPRILACDARILSCRSVPQGENLRAEGEAELRLFLCTGGTLSAKSVRVPYAVPLAVPEAGNAYAVAQISPVRLRRESPTVYRAECVMELSLRPRPILTSSLVQDLQESDAQKWMQDIAYLREEVTCAGTLSVQEDVLLDPALAEVGEILTMGGELNVTDCRANAGEAELTGELSAHLIYNPKGGGAPVRAHFTVPVSASLRCGEFSEGGMPSVTCAGVDLTALVYADVQGEDRLLHVSAQCEVMLQEAQTESARVLADAFCRDRELMVETQEIVLPQVPVHKTCTVPLRAAVPQDMAGAVQSLYTLAHLTIDSITSGAGQTRVEASLAAQVIGLEEGGSYRTFNLSAPVSFDLPGTAIDPDVTVASLNLQGQWSAGQWILTGKAVLHLSEYPEVRMQLCTGVTEGEALAPEAWDMKILIAGQGDTLWSLAKKSRVKPEELAACNPDLASQPVEAGDRILALR